jgi:hypothetical protein
MFDCIDQDCLDESSKAKETYPEIAYVMMYTLNGGLPQLYGGVYESEYDAQQYCIDNSTSSKHCYYYIATFNPPSQQALQAKSGPNYPNYVYPTGTMHNPNNYWDPQPPKVFAVDQDAANYCKTHSNENCTIQYSIQTWIPKNTYDYKKHGFVGHRFFNSEPATYVEPHQVIFMPETMKR